MPHLLCLAAGRQEHSPFWHPACSLRFVFGFFSKSWFTCWKNKEWSASLTHSSVVTYGQGGSLMEGENGLFWTGQSHATIEGCCIREPTPSVWMESKVAESYSWYCQSIFLDHCGSSVQAKVYFQWRDVQYTWNWLTQGWKHIPAICQDRTSYGKKIHWGVLLKPASKPLPQIFMENHPLPVDRRENIWEKTPHFLKFQKVYWTAKRLNEEKGTVLGA